MLGIFVLFGSLLSPKLLDTFVARTNEEIPLFFKLIISKSFRLGENLQKWYEVFPYIL